MFKVTGLAPGAYASPKKGARNQFWASVADSVEIGAHYEPVGVARMGSKL
jgi:hypothetical protein